MKYISLLHLSWICLSLVRGIYQDAPSFLCIKSPSSPLSTNTTLPQRRQHRLDHEPSCETSIKYDSFPRHRDNQWWCISLGPETWEHSRTSRQRSYPVRGSILRSQKKRKKKRKNHFLFLSMYKKISSFLSVFCLGMSRGVLRAQQWPQDREALEESAKTHAAARLRLRRPSGGSLWPSLSLCKNQCLPMMCYVKFPEAWFKWLDILHASLVILQCIAPKSTWTLHEKQM